MNNRNKIRQLISKRQAAENAVKDGVGKRTDSSASGDDDVGQDKSSETQKKPSQSHQVISPIMCYLIFCVVVIIYIVWSSLETYTGALYYDMD